MNANGSRAIEVGSLEVLLQRQASHILHNSRLTGQTLFQALKQTPDAIHVLEDMEAFFRQKNAQGVR
jgi:hypothetical protein